MSPLEDVQKVPQTTQVSQSPNRRDVLRMGVGLLGAAMMPRIARSEEQVAATANETIQYIRKLHIPGISHIAPHIHPKARYALLHIRQWHYAPNTSPSALQTVEDCQADIYKALAFLIDDPVVRLKNVYQEGVPDLPIQQPPAGITFISSLNQDYENQRISYLVAVGAEGKLIQEGKLMGIPGEGQKEMQEMWDGLSDPTLTEEKKVELYENRENSLLRLAMQRNDPMALTVYGSAHDWRNNIDLHNKWNPNSTFSLLTLTPHALNRRREINIVLNPN